MRKRRYVLQVEISGRVIGIKSIESCNSTRKTILIVNKIELEVSFRNNDSVNVENISQRHVFFYSFCEEKETLVDKNVTICSLHLFWYKPNFILKFLRNKRWNPIPLLLGEKL